MRAKVLMSHIVFWQVGVLLLLCLSVIGLRSELIPFKSFGGIFGLGLLVNLVLAFVVVFKCITGHAASLHYSLLGLALAILVISGVAYLLKQVASVPPIHDISTTWIDIPQFTQALKQRKPSDNSLAYKASTAAQQQKAYPELTTLTKLLSPKEALDKSLSIAKKLNWHVHFVDEANGLIEATDTSALFGFIDDIVIRIRYSNRQAQIDLRSASRVGQSDLGTNAKRIQQFSMMFNSTE